MLGMRNADVAGFRWVTKDMMTTLHAPQRPTIRFQVLDNLLAVHGGYYNHPKTEDNTRSTVFEP